MKHKYKPGAKIYCKCQDCFSWEEKFGDTEIYVIVTRHENGTYLAIWPYDPNSDFTILYSHIGLIKP